MLRVGTVHMSSAKIHKLLNTHPEARKCLIHACLLLWVIVCACVCITSYLSMYADTHLAMLIVVTILTKYCMISSITNLGIVITNKVYSYAMLHGSVILMCTHLCKSLSSVTKVHRHGQISAEIVVIMQHVLQLT